jgi:hypothetical protein
MKQRFVDHVPVVAGYEPVSASARDGLAHIQLRSNEGVTKEIAVQHVIAATGYKVDVSRLDFLSSAIRAQLRTIKGAPVLSFRFESSVSGLHFIGIAAANSFGPVMRFACGAGYSARRLARSFS